MTDSGMRNAEPLYIEGYHDGSRLVESLREQLVRQHHSEFDALTQVREIRRDTELLIRLCAALAMTTVGEDEHMRIAPGQREAFRYAVINLVTHIKSKITDRRE